MRLHWKKCLCSIAILGAGIPAASAQILTADDLVRAGVTRLSDLLELADDWTGSSTEGYHWNTAPLGTSWEATPDWSLFVDGQRISVRAFNRQSLNDLPMTVTEICEVQFHANPVVIRGHLAHGGAIQIARCVPSARVSVRGQFAAGNETGDPGPYKYTDSETANVDRTGPVVHAAISTGSERRFLQVTGATDEHHVTDPRIRPRVLQLYQGERDARIRYRALNLNARAFGHRISAGTSQVEDMLFLPFMGREIPLDKAIAFASASFHGKSYGYSLSGNSIVLNTRTNPESVSTDFSQGQVQAHGYATASLPGTLYFEYGGTAAFSGVHLESARLRDRLGTFRAYAVLKPDLLFDIQMQAMAALTVDASVLGYEVFSHVWHEGSGISARWMLRHRSPDSMMNFSSWIRRGYRPKDVVIRLDPKGLPVRESIYSADLSWTTGNRIKWQLSGGWRKYMNSVRPFTEMSLDSTGTRPQTVTSIVPAGGHVARTSLRIDAPLSEKLTVKLSGTYAYPWSQTHAFRDAWHQRIQMGMRGEFQPSDRFSLDLRLRYTGPALWDEFTEAARENPSFYVAQLPGTVHLHMTVQKRFWGNRLRMSATMRNVLDHLHLAHPAGGRTRSLFQVALRYAFGI